jgi:hypothetical protein
VRRLLIDPILWLTDVMVSRPDPSDVAVSRPDPSDVTVSRSRQPTSPAGVIV